MPRIFRYQGAIIRDHHILLIRHKEHVSGHDYWLIPGGGLENGETAEQCVVREMKEETHLTVKVERLLLEEYWDNDNVYRGSKTYLCTPISGEAQPGYEPEPEAASHYSIVEVKWVDLRDEMTWGEKIRGSSILEVIGIPYRKRMASVKQSSSGWCNIEIEERFLIFSSLTRAGYGEPGSRRFKILKTCLSIPG